MITTLISIVTFIAVLGILVFIHELGHFMVAKWTGMRVDEFALGFPPRLFGIKRGDTTYSLNALPLGGYVKIYGENGGGAEAEPSSFNSRPLWARAAVLVAGVSMNLLFAFFVLCIAYSFGFPAISEDIAAVPGAQVIDASVGVAGVLPQSAAERAGIRAGDTIISFKDPVDGSTAAVKTVAELQTVTASKRNEGHLNLVVLIDRAGIRSENPVSMSLQGPPLGVDVGSSLTVRVPWYRSPQAAVSVIRTVAGSTWNALKAFGTGLFHARLDKNISGPVGIYKATSSAAHEGFASVVFLTVALSINLALLNILPIPVLDGGKLLFVLIESLFRKKIIAQEIENTITSAAFVVLIGLISLITLKDLGLF